MGPIFEKQLEVSCHCLPATTSRPFQAAAASPPPLAETFAGPSRIHSPRKVMQEQPWVSLTAELRLSPSTPFACPPSREVRDMQNDSENLCRLRKRRQSQPDAASRLPSHALKDPEKRLSTGQGALQSLRTGRRLVPLPAPKPSNALTRVRQTKL